MSKFDHFMKNAFLVSLGVAAVCGMLILSFMNSKDIEFREIFEAETFHIGWDGDHFINDLDNINVNIRGNYSDYNTVDLYEEDNFDVTENIEIHASTEQIIFVHDDRDDIRVVFERQVPDTDSYRLDYSAKDIGNTLIVRSELSHNTIYAEQDYQGTITIYVPDDYRCEDLDLHVAVANHDFILPENTVEADIDVNFGSSTITIEHPMERLEMSVDAGEMKLSVKAPVGTVITNVDAGEIDVTVDDTIGKLNISTSLGSIDARLNVSPAVMDVDSNMGDVSLNFNEPITTLTANLDLGDLNIDVDRDDNSKVYIDTDIVDVNSVLKTTKDKSKANVFIEVNLGNVSIH